jgi:hypothetical protein
MDGGSGSEARGANRVEGEQRPRKSGFHIASAATVHPLSVDARLEGWRRPAIPIPCRHNIDMAVEDQRTPIAMRRTIRSNNIVSIFISRVDDRREPRQILDVVDFDLPVIHRQSAPGHGIRHQILNGVFLPAHRRATHHILREPGLGLEARVHCGDDRRGDVFIQHDRSLIQHGRSLFEQAEFNRHARFVHTNHF